MGGAIGLALTVWNTVKASKWATYALIAAIAVGMFLLWLARRDSAKYNAGFAKAVNKAAEAALARQARAREIDHEIRKLPLTERARRLRELSDTRR